MTDIPVVTLTTLLDGAAVELFQFELDRVLRNIENENTDPKAARKIVVEVTFLPDDDRGAGYVDVKVNGKLAAIRSDQKRVYFGRDHNQPVAREFDPKQIQMFEPTRAVEPIAAAMKGGGE